MCFPHWQVSRIGVFPETFLIQAHTMTGRFRSTAEHGVLFMLCSFCLIKAVIAPLSRHALRSMEACGTLKAHRADSLLEENPPPETHAAPGALAVDRVIRTMTEDGAHNAHCVHDTKQTREATEARA